jgi:tRNA A-37 threonylcarbamoyl transferase component Bud32
MAPGGTPPEIHFPKGKFITEEATLMGEGDSGFTFLNKLNGQDVVVKVPRFTPEIERKFKVAHRQFIEGYSMQNEKKVLGLQGLFVDEKILEDGRSVLAMKVAPGVTLKNFIRGGGIKTMVEYEKFFATVTEKLEDMWFRGIVHNDLHWGNIMVDKTSAGGYIVTIIDFGNADVGLIPKLFSEGQLHDFHTARDMLASIENKVLNFEKTQ